MYFFTDHSQSAFQIAFSRPKAVGVDGQWSTQDHQRRAILWCSHRLLDRQTANGLDGNSHSLHDLAQLIQRTGTRAAACDNPPTLIVPDVMDDKVAAEILKPLRGCHHVRSSKVVAHDLDAEILASFDDNFDRFGVGSFHHNHVSSPCLRHHLSLEPPTVHRLEISYDRNIGKSFAQSTYSIHALSDDQGRPDFQPVDASPKSYLSRFNGFGYVSNV